MRNSYRQFDLLQRQLDKMFDSMSISRQMISMYTSSAWKPSVDIYETTDEIKVLVELPGVNKDEMKLILDRNTLIITGVRRNEYRANCQACHQIEINQGEFERSIDIPVPVDPDRVTAKYRDGFLLVTLAKSDRPILKKLSITHTEE